MRTNADALRCSRGWYFASDLFFLLQVEGRYSVRLAKRGWSVVREDLLNASPDEHPLDAARDVFMKHLAHYTNNEMRTIDRLLRSSESLRARKQAFYEEQALFATFCEVWRHPQGRPALRMAAMACIGVVRLSLEAWSQQDTTTKPLADVLQEGFASLKLGIQ